jgi:hypothetical protein
VDMVRQRRLALQRPVPHTMAANIMPTATMLTAIGSVPGKILIDQRRALADGGRSNPYRGSKDQRCSRVALKDAAGQASFTRGIRILTDAPP